ncbi:MAG: hypothetical protein ACKN9T_01775 [Candidatus Methylumidiphilus sp.]
MNARLSLLLQRLLSVAVFAATAYAVANYPFAQVFLGAGLAVFAVWQQRQPTVWLLVLPLVLPLVNLAPWSGRFYLEDFDFFIMAAVAGALWQGAYSRLGRPRLARWPSLLVAAFLLTHCIALVRGLLPIAALDANAFSNYYSHYNALRVGKSLLWAVLLLPPLLRAFGAERERARDHLLLGVTLGVIGNGLAMLWERGVFTDLIYGQGIYAKIAGLTDFSTQYRGTALFAEMHTGGEATDGYIALAWPFALACLTAVASPWKMGVGVAGLPAGLYSALVTFSRGTYMAVAASLLTFAVPYSTQMLGQARASGRLLWPIPPLLLALLAACALLYQKGGYYAMVAALGIVGGAALAGFIRALGRTVRTVALLALLVGGFALMMRGLLTSKWVSNSFGEALALSLPLSVGALLAGLFIGGQVRGLFTLRGLGVGLVFMLTIITVGIPTVSGSYMQSRMSTAGGDMGGRMEHWRRAVELMDTGWDTYAFGMGLGVFPHAYLGGNDGEKSSIAALQEEDSNTYLSLSNSMDLVVGQRVSLPAGQTYTLSLDAKAQAAVAHLNINICRRNIISAQDYGCVGIEKNIAPGKWQTLAWTFDIGALGDGLKFGRHPLVLRMTHFHYNPQSENNLPLDFVDIDNIALFDRHGADHIGNGDFQAGLDLWYPYADHYHLPLHIKNLWVNVYFEQGLLGLAAFCALGLYTLLSGARLARQGDVFALALLSSLVGFYTVGLIGTLYDVPRVCFLFFLLLFTILAQDGAQLATFQGRRKDSPAPPQPRRPFVQPVR